MPMATKEAQREYQRQWISQRREEWIQANGPCAECGSWEDLEVDHKDRTEKSMEPAQIWSRRLEAREIELAKCQVLCSPCHLKKTNLEKADHSQNLPHGLKRYKNKSIKCRCETCREANSEYERNRRMGC